MPKRSTSHRSSTLCLLLLTLVSAGCGGGSSTTPDTPAPVALKAVPKLIEMGWDRSTPDKLLASVANLESSGLDGTTIVLHAGLSVFRTTPITASAMSQDLAELRQFHSARLTDNFILTWTTPETGWDWFDPQHVAALEQNATSYAQAAAAGGFKGLFLDTENYGASLWDYRLQVRTPGVTFAAYEAQARAVGARFATALGRGKPDLTLLLTWGLAYVESQFGSTPDKAKMAVHPYGLMPAFLDGMLSVIDPAMSVVELNEAAYGYVTPADYSAAQASYASLKPTLLGNESLRRWAKQYTLGQCLFADALLDLSHSARYFGYFLASDADRVRLFQQSIHSAMTTGERYVWIYSNNLNWWKATVPAPTNIALNAAAESARARAPLGFDLSSAVALARPRFDARVALSGRLTAAPGVQLPRASFAGLTTECGVADKDGYFACWFEGGWTGTLVPQASGHVFDPPVRGYVNLSRSDGGQNFTVTR